MATRIRYRRLTDSLLSATIEQYTVTINLKETSYTLHSEDQKHEGTANTLNAIKKAVKAKLKELGVQFDEETRNTRDAKAALDAHLDAARSLEPHDNP